jgi:hypothetical protein
VTSSTVELDLAADWLLDIDVPSTRSGKTELEQYLAEPIIPGVKDPLKWWYAKRDIWPNLSRMALDYHSIPCTLQITSHLSGTDINLIDSHIHQCGARFLARSPRPVVQPQSA